MIDTSKLRLLIRGKFLTDKSFAKALNLSNVELSKYLNGKKKIDIPMAERMLDVLEIPYTEFGNIFFNK